MTALESSSAEDAARPRTPEPSTEAAARFWFLFATAVCWAALFAYLVSRRAWLYGLPISSRLVIDEGAQSVLGFVICCAMAWSLDRTPDDPRRRLAKAVALSLMFSGLLALVFSLWLQGGSLVARVAGFFIGGVYVASLLLAWSFAYLAHMSYLRELAQARNLAELRQSALQARNGMLRQQINPHFLFNTLNAVHTLILDRQASAAREMLAAMSSFVRRALVASGDDLAPLSEEMAILDAYLAIQRGRFGERLIYRPAIPAALREALLPRLILQPLVENAIKHGLAVTARPVEVVITAARREGVLVLEVRDNGGEAEAGGELPPGLGVGLRNVEARLAGHFGAHGTITCRRLQPSGYRARLRLPLLFAAAAPPSTPT